MGTTLLPATHVVANADTWMEDRAIQQLHHTAQLPGMVSVAGMPDLHPGRGYPVGAAFVSSGILYPALVGNDIGCGMGLWQTDMMRHKWSATKCTEKLGNIDDPLNEAWDEDIAAFGLSNHPHRRSLGTIGGGNHFAEVQCVDTILVDGQTLAQLAPWLDPKRLLVLVHSGSRGLGEQLLRQHVDAFGHAGLPSQTPQARAYLTAHDAALDFARANRHLIAQRMATRFKTSLVEGVHIHHNFLAPLTTTDTPDLWIHRKGATPSTEGLVVIPGSRGAFSYLVQSLPQSTGLWSLAHGAGRKWQRRECIGHLSNRYRFQDLVRTELGSTVVCNDRDLMFEEAPQAYKDIDAVVQSLVDHDLCRVVARLKPVLTYKTSGACPC